jgi:hypothetical protein
MTSPKQKTILPTGYLGPLKNGSKPLKSYESIIMEIQEDFKELLELLKCQLIQKEVYIMNRKIKIRFDKPIALQASDIDASMWRYPFAIVEKRFVGKPEENSETIRSELEIWLSGSANIPGFQFDNDGNLIGHSNEEYDNTIFEHSRRFAIEEIKKGIDFREPIRYEISSELARRLPILDPDRIDDPEGVTIEIEIQSEIGFHQ